MISVDFLEQARLHGNPILEPGAAVFMWFGAEPPALIGDFNDWDSSRSQWEQGEANAWLQRIPLEPDAYIEYAFLRMGKGGGREPDPFNPHRTPNGTGAYNHFFYMPEGKPTPLMMRRQGVKPGRVSHRVLASSHLGLATATRKVHFYQPPVDGPVPLMVVLDGREYLQRARLPVILDNLIHHNRVQPVALAMLENGGKARPVEYTCSEATLGTIVTDLIPMAQQELDLLPQDSCTYGVMGASLGGLMAVFMGLRGSPLFTRVLSQSGAFRFGEYDTVVMDLVRHGDVKPLQIWMDVGKYEWLLECNRDMHQLLLDRGYPVTFHEYSAGHNYPAWRNDLAAGLEALYPPMH